MRRPLCAGNWKMNGLAASAAELEKMIAGYGDLHRKVDLMVCPPATLIAAFAELAKNSRIAIGAQDCHPEPFGAFTGDISAEMLADVGASAVLVGHSERRTYHDETDGEVHKKVLAAWRAGITAIACVGETRAERDAGQTLNVIGRQLSASLPDGAVAERLVVAYEPVWAIGSGLTPTTADVAKVHRFIRAQLAQRYGDAASGIRILYGGSVKPANAKELLTAADVDGALVGGASLKSQEFLGIAAAYL